MIGRSVQCEQDSKNGRDKLFDSSIFAQNVRSSRRFLESKTHVFVYYLRESQSQAIDPKAFGRKILHVWWPGSIYEHWGDDIQFCARSKLDLRHVGYDIRLIGGIVSIHLIHSGSSCNWNSQDSTPTHIRIHTIPWTADIWKHTHATRSSSEPTCNAKYIQTHSIEPFCLPVHRIHKNTIFWTVAVIQHFLFSFFPFSPFGSFCDFMCFLLNLSVWSFVSACVCVLRLQHIRNALLFQSVNFQIVMCSDFYCVRSVCSFMYLIFSILALFPSTTRIASLFRFYGFSSMNGPVYE